MKIKVIKKTYEEVKNIQPKKLKPPKKPHIFWRTLIKLISLPALISRKFRYNKEVLKQIPNKTPCLFLMNHSSFIDLEIAESILYPRVFNIVCTNDGFVGKNWLMRQIGCINTPKYVSDPALVKRMISIVKKKRSILMYPEACYSFDGTSSILPFSLAKLVKMLNVDIVTIISQGAYLHQPLYNELRKRKINVSAQIKHLIKKEEIKNLTEEEIFSRIKEEFSFDNFLYQQQNNIIINEKERAVGLNRLLYKCPHCYKEGNMETKEDQIYCINCNNKYRLEENGYLKSINNKTIFNHIPTWYQWQKRRSKKRN